MIKIYLDGNKDNFNNLLIEGLQELNFEIDTNIDSSDIIIINENKNTYNKTKTLKKPVILITSSKTTGKNIIKKPISISDLAKKINLIIDQKQKQKISEINFKHFKYSHNTKTITNTKINEKHRLTDKESEILTNLYLAKDHFKTKEDLLKEVWEYGSDIETKTLETHIYKLRAKIEDEKENPKILITDNLGYKLNI
jgi:DNA-binding response OmpR family regulator